MKYLPSTVVTIRIRSDQIEKVKYSEMNLSEFVRNKLDEEFETQDSLIQKENELLEEIESIKRIRTKIGEDTKITKEEYTSEEIKFFKEAKEKVSENIDYLDGQFKKYKNLFDRKITLEMFRKLINERN